MHLSILTVNACVHGVCVCVHLDGLNAEHKFRVWVTILGHTSLHFIILHFMVTEEKSASPDST